MKTTLSLLTWTDDEAYCDAYNNSQGVGSHNVSHCHQSDTSVRLGVSVGCTWEFRHKVVYVSKTPKYIVSPAIHSECSNRSSWFLVYIHTTQIHRDWNYAIKALKSLKARVTLYSLKTTKRNTQPKYLHTQYLKYMYIINEAINVDPRDIRGPQTRCCINDWLAR